MKVFSKKKYLECLKQHGLQHLPVANWPDQCDGKSKKDCYPYTIADEWMVDVKDYHKPQPKMHIVIDCDDGKTTTARLIVNGREVKKAVARHNPADKFDFRIGAQLAFERLFAKKQKPQKKPAASGGNPVREIIKMWEDINHRTKISVREVKRTAQVGEYIKVVEAFATGGKYKNGDILRVTDVSDSYVLCKGIDAIILHSEYVVLENWLGGERRNG